MAEAAQKLSGDHYEVACDQAIAMCDGNVRSAVKALLMANEYLESELQQLQAQLWRELVGVGGGRDIASGQAGVALPVDRSGWRD